LDYVKTVFVQQATRKITFIESSSLGGKNVIMYTATGEVWFTALRW